MHTSSAPEIARHKAALNRSDISRPVRMALAEGILNSSTSFFDYGCGRGGDISRVRALGIIANGWDPAFRAEVEHLKACVVNIGYVINVIENPRERIEVIQKAWSLAEKVLVVSARLSSEEKNLSASEEFSDGLLTSIGTFQKFYDQAELKNWIESVLGTTAIPAGPGVFYVFRKSEDRASYLSTRYRRRIAAPTPSLSSKLYEQYQEELVPLISFFTSRGRLPSIDELDSFSQIEEIFGSIKKAFRVVQNVTRKEQWDEIRNERAEELLIFLALSRFDGRPKLSELPKDMQLDVREFFSRYNRACEQADEMLFSVGDIQQMNEICASSDLGKKLPGALYIHVSALDKLAAPLRLYEGCARGLIGNVEEATIIKLNRAEPKISYLSYPDFDDDPHPALTQSISVNLQTFRVKYRNFKTYKNPPILHRKELFVSSDYTHYEKFARLTRIEDSKGLYYKTDQIGTRQGWEQVLENHGLELKGHRLVRRKS